MAKYSSCQKIMFIGDKSKYLFIKDYFSEDVQINLTIDELENYTIYLMYSEKGYIERYDDSDIIVIASNKVPMAKVIVIPRDFFDTEDIGKKIEKVLVFSSFPYTKQNILEDVEMVLKEFEVADVLAILYKEERRFGATDLSTEEESLRMAEETYSKKNIPSSIYSPGEAKEEIFNVDPNFIRAFKESYENNFFKAVNRFIERYDKEYDLHVKAYFGMFTLLDPEEYDKFNKLFSYEKNKDSIDLWSNFVYGFQKGYMDGKEGILQVVADFYKRFIIDISFWDLEEDGERLKRVILKEYKECFGSVKKLKAPENELQYVRMMNESKDNSLEVIFKNKLNFFVEDRLRNIVKDFLEKRFEAIKVGEDEQ